MAEQEERVFMTLVEKIFSVIAIIIAWSFAIAFTVYFKNIWASSFFIIYFSFCTWGTVSDWKNGWIPNDDYPPE